MAPKAGLDRGVVVAAAATLLDAADGREVSLGELASHLGVRTPSLYNHVAGQEGLRREVALLGTRELRECLTQAAVGKHGDDALVALARAYRAFAKARPGLYATTLRAPAPDDTAHIESSAQVLAVLQAVFAGYALHAHDAVHVIRGFRSLLHGFVALETGGGFGMPVDVDESFERLVQMFIAGLRQPT